MSPLQELRWRLWARTRRPILIGPWRSELGFESLYWLPWLTAWRQKYGIKKERLIAISRGGAGIWYDAAKTVDLYDYVPVEKVRQAMLRDAKAVGSVKQLTVTSWERKLLPLIAEDLGVRRAHVLHPSVMYRQLTPWWHGRMGLAAMLPSLAFAPIPVPVPPLSLALPEKFVAVRFYARHTWPLTEELRTWVSNVVDGLAKHLPVVVLESGLHADDHLDFPISGPNIVSLAPHVTLQNNLAVQSAVLAKAHAFVGTYGGVMQLAVRLKKPAVGFYAKFEGTAEAHKHLTEWLAVQQGTPVFIGRPDDARIVKEVLGG
jgi:hypothetical protein